MNNSCSNFADRCDLYICNFPYNKFGIIETRGAKNAALPMIMYSFIHDTCDIRLGNVPDIADVQSTLDMLEAMGGQYEFDRKQGNLRITHGITHNQIPAELIRQTRISVLLMSILLAKFGSVLFPTEVGGCKIGTRNLDYHLDAFRSLGCDIHETVGCIRITQREDVPAKTTIAFPCPTTTGTANAIILASNTKSETTVENAHLRTEVLELISFMRQCGCDISIENGNIVVNDGTDQRIKHVSKTVRSDLEETLTYLSLGYVTDSTIKVQFSNPYTFEEISFMKELARGTLDQDGQGLMQHPFSPEQRHDMVTLETGPYPQIGSDSQPILSALLLHMAKKFRVVDHRFSDRFSHIEHFKAYNILVEKVENRVEVSSPRNRSDCNTVCELEAQNLRCAISALLTASYFQQPVLLRNAHYMQRGYSNIFENLETLGFTTSIVS